MDFEVFWIVFPLLTVCNFSFYNLDDFLILFTPMFMVVPVFVFTIFGTVRNKLAAITSSEVFDTSASCTRIRWIFLIVLFFRKAQYWHYIVFLFIVFELFALFFMWLMPIFHLTFSATVAHDVTFWTSRHVFFSNSTRFALCCHFSPFQFFANSINREVEI